MVKWGDAHLDCNKSFDGLVDWGVVAAAGTIKLWTDVSDVFKSDVLFVMELSRCASVDFLSVEFDRELFFESFCSFVISFGSFDSLSLVSLSFTFFDGPRRFGGGAFDAHT